VLGSSIDTQFAQGAYAERLGLRFPLVSDWPRYRTTRAFEVYQEERGWDLRMTYVMDREGIIRHVLHDEENFARHAVEALETVRRLG
jgi:peroxiredoxin